MEENEEIKDEAYIGYKIDTKHTYKVYVNETKGKRYYKVQIKKKNYDGTETNFYKQLRFVKCNPPEDGEIIKIKRGFEDLYYNTVDKYNPISVVVVMDYELVENKVVNDAKAYDKFQQILNENENGDEFTDLPF